MNNSIKISIPYELASYAIRQGETVASYQSNTIIKAIDTWLVLKHESVPSLIQSWRKQRTHLLQLCKCNENTFRSRLQLLKKLKLISFLSTDRKNDSIQLCSWETLGKLLQVDIEKKFTLQYNVNDNKKIYQWIIAAEIEANKQKQDIAVIRKLNKNPEACNAVLCTLVHRGYDLKKLQSSADYFLSAMRTLYMDDFIRESEIHSELIEYRPDNNRGVVTMADHWNVKHPQRVSYWKQQLEKSEIIYIVKLQIESQERVRNKHCKVLWVDKVKDTLLCLCDQITILKPWEERTDFLQSIHSFQSPLK